MLHGRGYVHLDVKPDNILVSKGSYKIADLGLAAAALGSGCDDIAEGDCRYLAREVLRGDFTNLPKADVFSLGLVCYELAASPAPMPCNGEDWHRLREGRFDASPLEQFSEGLRELLCRSLHPTPAQRPPCEEITQHPSVAPDDGLEAYPRGTLQAQTLVAEKHKQLADEYWQELVSMKRQELLGAATTGLAGSTQRTLNAIAGLGAGSNSARCSAAVAAATAVMAQGVAGASGGARNGVGVPRLQRGLTA